MPFVGTKDSGFGPGGGGPIGTGVCQYRARFVPVHGGYRVSAEERIHVVVDPRDNVTTVLDQRTDLDRLQGSMGVALGVPFGHKVALRPIARGGPVIKYGVAIGRATCDIASGAHVHVHNCA